MLWKCRSGCGEGGIGGGGRRARRPEGEAAGVGALLGGRWWEGSSTGTVIHKTRGEVIRVGQGWH